MTPGTGVSGAPFIQKCFLNTFYPSGLCWALEFRRKGDGVFVLGFAGRAEQVATSQCEGVNKCEGRERLQGDDN